MYQKPEMVFKKLHDGAVLPEKAFSYDAGFDLALPEDQLFEAGQTQVVGLGLAVHLDWAEFALLVGRSSTLPRYDLLVVIGIIDAGYQGELKAVVRNLGSDLVLKAGTRLFQLVPMTNTGSGRDAVWTNLGGSGSDRGSGGFGSTG